MAEGRRSSSRIGTPFSVTNSASHTTKGLMRQLRTSLNALLWLLSRIAVAAIIVGYFVAK